MEERPSGSGRHGDVAGPAERVRGHGIACSTTVRGGRSAVLVVRGEAGIGKTALLQYCRAGIGVRGGTEQPALNRRWNSPLLGCTSCAPPCSAGSGCLRSRNARRCRWLWVSSRGRARTGSWSPWRRSVSCRRQRSSSRRLCVVDDAQWLDHARRRPSGFVGRRLLAEPIALVFAARDPVPSRDELAGLPELRLRGLDDTAARAVLATVVSGPVDELGARPRRRGAYGNPLALLEFWWRPQWSPGRRWVRSPGRSAAPRADRGAVRGPPRRATSRRPAAGPPRGSRPRGGTRRCSSEPPASSVSRSGPLSSQPMPACSRSPRPCASGNPLVRSAAYRRASIEDRRAAHGALAAATDARPTPTGGLAPCARRPGTRRRCSRRAHHLRRPCSWPRGGRRLGRVLGAGRGAHPRR